ncbi:MAG: PKD domain-containing protein, partial [Bacteroidota bacterium]
MKYTLTFILVLSLFSGLQAQSTYDLVFGNPQTLNGSFCLEVTVAFDAAAGLGTSNLVFQFNENAVANPRIESSALSSPLTYQTPSLTVPSNERGSINIVLNAAGFGYPIDNNPVQVFQICFDVVDANQTVNLNWLEFGSTATVVFTDANNPIQLSAGTLTNYNGLIPPPNTPPVAAFAMSADQGPAPLAINFDATASSDDNGIVSYSWDFGDGNTASGQIVDHTYLSPGTYYAILTVSDQEGLSDNQTDTITVEDGACFQFDNGEVVIEAENYSATQSGSGSSSGVSWLTYSDANASDGQAVRAEPNTGSYTGLNLNGPRLDYDVYFDTPGIYNLYVRSSAPSGNDDSFHAGLDGQAVTNQTGIGMHRVGDWAWAQSANNGIQVQLDVQSTGQHTINLWMREDGVQIDKLVLTTSSATPNGQGPAQSITGSCGNGPGNQIPEAQISSSAINGIAPLTINFDGLSSTDAEGPIASYAWDFGDGTTATGSIQDHTFAQAGLYTVSLTVTDQGGLSDTDEIQIQVNPDPNAATCWEEVNGLVVIEAEDFGASFPGTANASASSWQSFSDPAASGGSALRATPNTGVSTGLNINGPRLDYEINFNTTGTYQIYVRNAAPSANDDSYHVGFDGQALTNLSGYGMGVSGAWDWDGFANGSLPIEFTVNAPGKHTFNLWMREDGVEVDKIVITQSLVPSGQGPAISNLASCNGAANQAPTASLVATPTVGFAP